MSLAELWYILVLLPFVVYILLDGLDIGTGLIMPFLARTSAEREALLTAIGPIWDANEVWLLAAGATTLMAFPAAMGTALSGFYLPFLLVLWLLCFRALGVEMRHFLEHPLWLSFWQRAFIIASTALAVVFGLALGNLLRGVDWYEATKSGEHAGFFVALWTDLWIEPPVGIIDVYTLTVTCYCALALAVHAGAWLALRCCDELAERALRLVRVAAYACLAAFVVCSLATAAVQERLGAALSRSPWAGLWPCLALAGLALVLIGVHRGRSLRVMQASVLHLTGALISAAYGIYPYLVPGRVPGTGMTITDAASPEYALRVGLYWWVPGIMGISAIFVWQYRRLLRSPRIEI